MQNTAKKPPTFSIITVTLNHLEGLKKTQSSLEKQTETDFEWIVIDGNSSDETKSHLENLTFNAPFLWVSEPDAGLYEAMNKGLKKSTGQYVLFLNAGDTLNTAETLGKIKKISAKNPDFIYGDALETIEKKPFLKEARPAKNILWGMVTHHQSMLYKRSIITENKLRFRQIYSIAADYEFTIRFLKLCKKAVHIPLPICHFETGGISQQNAFEGRRQQYIIREDLNLCPLWMNMIIFLSQTILWTLRTHTPALYILLKKLYSLIK